MLNTLEKGERLKFRLINNNKIIYFMTHGAQQEISIFLDSKFQQVIASEFCLNEIIVHIDTPVGLSIPAFSKSSWFKKDRLIIGAGFDKTGDIDSISTPQFHQALEAFIHSPNISYEMVEVRTKHCFPGHRDHSDKVELGVHLASSTEQQWKQLSRNTRKNIRRAEKMGFHYKILNTIEALDIFYELYVKSIHSLGSLPHKKSFFQKLLTQCQHHIAIFIGYFGDQPVVASFNFITQEEIYGAWSGFEPDMKKHNIFLAMLWGITEHSIEKQYRVYNLGRSSLGSNQYQFKKKIANYEHKIYYYQLKPLYTKHNHTSITKKWASKVLRHFPLPLLQYIANRFIHRFY